ncbi:A/G-specific adenine glycosylase [Fulvivirga sedimenti]|uniref:Adenine DNA glycosylase n=1 Tax=Fulvivirga sedimenti TaxID=2879465 RepID=A0A9X1HVC1_9BACT|nr:A/G-specific adenine glycosylase [Fulvivirga sedimenti]MCA6078615.1 A/G-specific adenine glycosylase [Fulvivirga sedimenti]
MVEPSEISAGILQWYEKFKRDLPWRKTTDPYKIWLSEIILQQTRVNQGLPYYHKFTELFPDIYALSAASEKEVLKAWEGLGYYSRARNLHQCAKIICEKHGGFFPNSYQKLLDLPGIGPYTAAAIASFCYNEPVAVVDGNVFRVLARLYAIDADIRVSQKLFREIAQQLIPHDTPGTFNQAIMEFGALQCTPQSPDCGSCPLQVHCLARKAGKQDRYPVKSPAKKARKRYFHYLVLTQDENIYMRPRPSGDIWQGLYDFPLIEKEEFMKDDDLLHAAEQLLSGPSILQDVSAVYEHQLSHQKLHVRFYRLKPHKNMKLSDLMDNLICLDNPEQAGSLPKPVLITRYLNEHFF